MIRIAALTVSLLLATAPVALAQQAPISNASTAFVLSWRSNGFAPAGYQGRVAAAGKGTVLVTAEAISNGQLVDLNRYEMRWYLNDKFFESGFGLQSITIPVPEFHQTEMDVRAEIIGSNLPITETVLTVPLTEPIAVIESPTRGTLRSGATVLRAHAYSFNVSSPDDLLYTWSVNGEEPVANESPRTLNLTVDGTPTGPAYVTLQVMHPERSEESAALQLKLVPEAEVEQ